MAQAQAAVAPKKMRAAIESGCPDGMQYMHPLMLKNFGNWKYHDRPRPGVLHHVAYSGDEIWTVRVGTSVVCATVVVSTATAAAETSTVELVSATRNFTGRL